MNEAELSARYRLMPRGKAKDWWDGEVERIPPTVYKTVFLLSGALIPVWRLVKNVKETSFKIVRTTTDEGVRLVGLQIPKLAVKEIVRLFDVVWEREETSADIYQSILDDKESVELVENIRLKCSKFFGETYIEIVPGRFEHPKRFRSIGLTCITQNSRDRFLLPQNEENAFELLKKVLMQFPPASGTGSVERMISKNLQEKSQNFEKQVEAQESAPIDVREWLIEPDDDELTRIRTR